MPIAYDDDADNAMESAQRSVFRNALFFAAIIGVVALYVRWSKRRKERDGQGYEKTLA